jgi:hypothetical protein
VPDRRGRAEHPAGAGPGQWAGRWGGLCTQVCSGPLQLGAAAPRVGRAVRPGRAHGGDSAPRGVLDPGAAAHDARAAGSPGSRGTWARGHVGMAGFTLVLARAGAGLSARRKFAGCPVRLGFGSRDSPPGPLPARARRAPRPRTARRPQRRPAAAAAAAGSHGDAGALRAPRASDCQSASPPGPAASARCPTILSGPAPRVQPGPAGRPPRAGARVPQAVAGPEPRTPSASAQARPFKFRNEAVRVPGPSVRVRAGGGPGRRWWAARVHSEPDRSPSPRSARAKRRSRGGSPRSRLPAGPRPARLRVGPSSRPPQPRPSRARPGAAGLPFAARPDTSGA